MRALQGITAEYRRLNILNYEMECGTLFKMAGVYNFAAACVCAVVAQRPSSEEILLEQNEGAIKNAIAVAICAVENLA